MNNLTMEQWIGDELSNVLGFPVPQDLVQYVMSIETEPDFNDYMKTLLDFDNVKHRNFFAELSMRKFSGKGKGAIPKQKKKISKTNKPQKDFVSMDTTPAPEVPVEPPEKEGNTEGKKKKTKFVNLYSKEGQNAQVIMLKGRHRCDCEAYKHELINNCLECGRIVCTQEGSGPCLFCGALVCTEEEEKEIMSKGGSKLKDQLMQRQRPAGWEEALAYRNRLLDYQANSEKRTQVVDDDCDYFNTNSVWLSPAEREQLEAYQQQLHEAKHLPRSKQQKKMTFDFAGRQVIEEERTVESVDLERIRQITSGGAGATPAPEFRNDVVTPFSLTADRDVAPGLNAATFQFDSSAVQQKEHSSSKKPMSSYASRVQDQGYQVMVDTGKCLSMHQPWASLLVEGIKLHEGRTWYSSHRGRLWIASTAKPPDQETISAIEKQYKLFYPEQEVSFPSFYPTGCLLGCVTVDDCLTQEEYQNIYPGGESDSPYVFICSDPVSLKLRFPIKGQHKIYQLEKSIHTAAAKCIQNMGKMATAADVTAG